jgi:excisionase family DNA binding protein
MIVGQISYLKPLIPTSMLTNQEDFQQEIKKKGSTRDTQIALPKFLTAEEAAELLRVKPKTVHTWISQQRIPVRYAGGRPVFLLEELLNWTLPENDRWETYRLPHGRVGKISADRLTANWERRNPNGSL